MNTDRINSWLTLLANLGVLVGIIVVVFELEQTQIAMQAEASTVRAQMARENGRHFVEHNLADVTERLRRGEAISEEEATAVRVRMSSLLRYYENLHYHWQLGVLDEEIWETNLFGIRGMLDNPLFVYSYPDWPNDVAANVHRQSFVELIESYRNQ